jgi:hypothetical protein
MPDRATVVKVLDLARWAPSGDNTQPWRFEIVADDHVVIHGHDTRDNVVYDFEGQASQMAHGALLETLRLAATEFGLRAEWSRRPGSPDTGPIYDVRLAEETGLVRDPLVAAIRSRAVQRRPMKFTPLTDAQRERLAASVGPRYRAHWYEPLGARFKVARLLWNNAGIRLTCPEAYPVHRDMIEWNTQFSEDRIPDRAVGVDPMTLKLMRWVMQDWKRVDRFNRHLLGTVPPRIQLDFLPGIFCAAHLALVADDAPQTVEDFVEAGVAMQRLWLTAEVEGLALQPEMTPLIFSWYARAGRPLSREAGINDAVMRLAQQLDDTLGEDVARGGVFLCRIGRSAPIRSRSTRLPLEKLWHEAHP